MCVIVDAAAACQRACVLVRSCLRILTLSFLETSHTQSAGLGSWIKKKAQINERTLAGAIHCYCIIASTAIHHPWCPSDSAASHSSCYSTEYIPSTSISGHPYQILVTARVTGFLVHLPVSACLLDACLIALARSLAGWMAD